MLTENNILTIGESNFGQKWRMTLDLNVITEEAGVRKRNTWTDPKTGVRYREDFTPMPLPRARKLINLILQYAEPEELEAIGAVFRKNQRLYQIWREKLSKGGFV